jgi:chemosensory pili system protein ChpA (sensor histidine kinase/response regulator)
VSGPNQESVELFLQEASENLQYLREYSGLLSEPQTRPEDLEKLYIAAHTLAGTSASYGFPHFSEVAAKMAHIFHYAMNASLTPDMHGPLTEFLSDAISVLEFDLLQISSSGAETVEDISQFKQRYAFAFPVAPSTETVSELGTAEVGAGEPIPAVFPGVSYAEQLPEDGEVPDEVLEFFIPEADEHLQAVTDCLLALEANPNPDDIHRLFRSMHTIKGSAAQVGLHRISAIAHRVEDLFGQLRDGALKPNAEIVDLCLDAVDVLKKFLHRQWPSQADMAAAVDPLLARIAEIAPEEAPEPVAKSDAGADEKAAAEDRSGASAARPAAAQALPQAKSVRISLERLDRMMNAVGELVINRTRMLGRLAELSKLVEVLNFSKGRLSGKISDFQEKHEFSRLDVPLVPGSQPPQMDTLGKHITARPAVMSPAVMSPAVMSNDLLEFSELEMDRYDDFNILSRSLTEISADVTEVLTQLEGFMGRVDADIDEFTKLAHHLQDEITAARMVPIGNLYSRLSRTVRDAAKAAGKSIDLSLEGAETELDNNIIQHISDPLIHLVRNAVAHGIEDRRVRRDAGKPEKARITVRAYHRGNHIFIEVEDDGRGIDYEKVRHKVIESGAMSPVSAAELSDRELREFLFRPGFTTATEMSELAGRGVGLDVVRANVHALNGEIEVRSELGRGACFTVKVPLTLIISQALFVRCGASSFAFPLALVEEIRRLRPEEVEEVGGKLLTRVRGEIMEVVRLDLQLALPPLEPINGYFHMVIVKVAGKHAGVVVEEVLGKDEIVIKNLGDYLRRVKLFPGTTISSDGSLILLIDLNRLVAADTAERHALPASSPAARVFAPGAEAVAAGSIPAEAVDAIADDRVVVVADDSISVRKFVGRMLEKAGYRVKLASDGLEASEIVAQVGCHLLITDLEMPRMNGYELMAHLRQNPATRRIPVLVVTSRAGAKHRDRAMKEGASAFLTKPVQEDQLLSTVESLIGSEAVEERPGTRMPLRQD